MSNEFLHVVELRSVKKLIFLMPTVFKHDAEKNIPNAHDQAIAHFSF